MNARKHLLYVKDRIHCTMYDRICRAEHSMLIAAYTNMT